MKQRDLEPGMLIQGQNRRSGTAGTREIISMGENRLTYRCRSFLRCRGDISMVPHLEFTCSIPTFLEWAEREVEG